MSTRSHLSLLQSIVRVRNLCHRRDFILLPVHYDKVNSSPELKFSSFAGTSVSIAGF